MAGSGYQKQAWKSKDSFTQRQDMSKQMAQQIQDFDADMLGKFIGDPPHLSQTDMQLLRMREQSKLRDTNARSMVMNPVLYGGLNAGSVAMLVGMFAMFAITGGPGSLDVGTEARIDKAERHQKALEYNEKVAEMEHRKDSGKRPISYLPPGPWQNFALGHMQKKRDKMLEKNDYTVSIEPQVISNCMIGSYVNAYKAWQKTNDPDELTEIKENLLKDREVISKVAKANGISMDFLNGQLVPMQMMALRCNGEGIAQIGGEYLKAGVDKNDWVEFSDFKEFLPYIEGKDFGLDPLKEDSKKAAAKKPDFKLEDAMAEVIKILKSQGAGEERQSETGDRTESSENENERTEQSEKSEQSDRENEEQQQHHENEQRQHRKIWNPWESGGAPMPQLAFADSNGNVFPEVYRMYRDGDANADKISAASYVSSWSNQELNVNRDGCSFDYTAYIRELESKDYDEGMQGYDTAIAKMGFTEREAALLKTAILDGGDSLPPDFAKTAVDALFGSESEIFEGAHVVRFSQSDAPGCLTPNGAGRFMSAFQQAGCKEALCGKEVNDLEVAGMLMGDEARHRMLPAWVILNAARDSLSPDKQDAFTDSVSAEISDRIACYEVKSSAYLDYEGKFAFSKNNSLFKDSDYMPNHERLTRATAALSDTFGVTVQGVQKQASDRLAELRDIWGGFYTDGNAGDNSKEAPQIELD